MRICIVTLFKTSNSGSVLQAYALGKFLEKAGNTVYYYNARYLKNRSIRNVAGFVKMFLKNGLNGLKNYHDSQRNFKSIRDGFIIIDESRKKYIDCYVLGSDTIWNLDSDNLKNCISTFWGLDFPGKIITYAGSVANASEEKFLFNTDISKAVNRWSAISVRDKYTQRIISQLTSKKVSIVCDPTLLLKPNDYNDIIRPSNRNKKYIFLYLFSKLTTTQYNQLRSFSDKMGYSIIQGTFINTHSVIDQYVPNSPSYFLSGIFEADYVITDTFHGTIFSLLYNKQFVSINRKKNKVNELLAQVGLEDRLVDNDIIGTLIEPIEYMDVNQKIDEIKTQSMDFLQKALQ